MGVRRKSRRRLAAINKKGVIKDVTASTAVMSNNIVAASQFRMGQMVVTDMVLDLAGAKNTLYTKAAAAADPIGTNSTDVSYVCNLGESVFGVVTQVETVNLEQCTDGTLKDYDLMFAGDGTLDGHASSGNDGYLGSDATGDTGLASDIFASGGSAIGKHTTTQVDTSVSARGLLNRYLYITAGDATTAKASAVIECGAADVDNITSGLTRIRLARSDGSTTIDIVADSSKAKAATDAGFFGTSDVSTAAHLALSIKNGIGATTDNGGVYTTAVTDTTNVTVTVYPVNATSNNTNYLVDDPEKSSGIVLPNFTGGMPNAITAGKVLVRVTGFVIPDDL